MRERDSVAMWGGRQQAHALVALLGSAMPSMLRAGPLLQGPAGGLAAATSIEGPHL